MPPVPTPSEQPPLLPVSIPPKKEKSRLFRLFIFFSFFLLFVVVVGVILVFSLRCTQYWPGFSACNGKLLHSGVEMLATRDAYFVKSPLRQDIPCEEDITDGREYARCAITPAGENATTTIDAASFSFLSNSFSDTEWYAKDKNNAYYLNLNNCRDSACVSTFHIIEGADPASFHVESSTIHGAYGTADAHNLYNYGCKLYGASVTDPATSLRENPNSYSVRRLEYESNYQGGRTTEWPCAYFGWKQFSDKEGGITFLYPDWLESEDPEVTHDGKTWINFSAKYTPVGGFGITRASASQEKSTSDYPIYDACVRGQPYLAASFEKETPKLNVTKATLESRVAERLKQYLGGALVVDLLALRSDETCYVVRVFDQEFIKDELNIERIFNSIFIGGTPSGQSMEPSSTVSNTNPQSQASGNQGQYRTIVLYHYTGAEYQSIGRQISSVPRITDATLKLLFATYLPALKSEYTSVSLANGVATVNFKQGAHTYFDQASAGVSAEYVNSIRKTLLQFSTITQVQFSIDGGVIVNWDA